MYAAILNMTSKKDLASNIVNLNTFQSEVHMAPLFERVAYNIIAIEENFKWKIYEGSEWKHHTWALPNKSMSERTLKLN